MKIKTRFSPSPTGYLHIGSIRTALYSWLFARQNNGKFVLRIEDTDLKRSTPQAINTIMDGMNWLNLQWDEGPYFQSKRFDRYNMVINNMLLAGTAYKCYCSKERLKFLREKQMKSGSKPHYDGYCRYKNTKGSANQSYVVRFANPQNGSVIFNDKIRGQVEFSNQELDDVIICRADGTPTYNFCVVIDDWDMEISHVIRGEDHLSNTPRQINILRALNAPIPVYAHVSMIHCSNGKKLSKRYGAVSVMQYRDDGYLPEALLNYLVRLGWSSGNQEIFSREEMIKLFSLSALNKSASTFDANKLLWLNHYYINSMPEGYIATCLKTQIKNAKINIDSGPEPVELIKLFGKRSKTLKEIADNSRYFYEEFDKFDEGAAEKYLCPIVYHPLKVVHSKLHSLKEWTKENIYCAIQTTMQELAIGMHTIGMPLRVALTGKSYSPELHVVIYMIGKNRSTERIHKALNFIIERNS